MTLFSLIQIKTLFMRFKIKKSVNKAQIHCESAQIGCEVTVFVILNVFFFIEEVFVKVFCLVMTTVTVRLN